MGISDPIEEPRKPASLEEMMKAQEDALELIEGKLADCLRKKEGAPTIEELEDKLVEIGVILSKINKLVPGDVLPENVAKMR